MAEVGKNSVEVDDSSEVDKDTSEIKNGSTEVDKDPAAVDKDSAKIDKDSAQVMDSTDVDKDAAEVDKDSSAVLKQGLPIEEQIIRQIEYYFGDANLLRDKFLLDQIAAHNDGWVPLSTLLTFNRLAKICKDEAFIAEVLAKSDSNIVEISEDKLTVRRNPEYPIPELNEEKRKELLTRTAYVKGFPLDSEISALIDFFAPHKPANIVMRKYFDKPTKTYKFKGSIFLTFDSVEKAKEFIEGAEISYEGRPLIVMWQEKYIVEKRAKDGQKKNKRKLTKGKEKQNQEDKDAEVEKIQLPKGSVLKYKNDNKNVVHQMLRDAIKEVGDFPVAYIEYSDSEENGYIRFQEENGAHKFLEELGGNKLKVTEKLSLEVQTLDEEEEEVYLKKAAVDIATRRVEMKSKHDTRKRRSGDNSYKYQNKKKR